jgi:hypothetical protein
MTRLVLLGIAVWLHALPASAQVHDQMFTGSPRYGGIQLKMGKYSPLLDREPGLTPNAEGQLPYAATFGDKSLLMFEVEGERFLYQGYGTAGLSLSAGYGEAYVRSLTVGGTATADVNGFQVLPLRFMVLYKLDYPAFHWNVPIVPYGQFGFAATPFRFKNGGTTELSGIRYGHAATAGVQLMLDFLEPSLSRNLDSDTGVNHSYLFAEYTYARVNNFGKPGPDLSSRDWMFGFALDY